MKKLLALLAFVAGTLIAPAASYTEAYTLPYNSTNTVYSNAPALIKTLYFYNPSTATATIRLYDSITNATSYTNTAAYTNVSLSTVTNTEFFTNAVYSFRTAAGHMTNIVKYTTNTTTMLSSLRTNTAAGTIELNRLGTFTIAPSSTAFIPFPDVNIFVNQGVTAANVTGATNVVMMMTYLR